MKPTSGAAIRSGWSIPISVATTTSRGLSAAPPATRSSDSAYLSIPPVESMCTPSDDDVARGDVLHDARRAAALGVDQEVRSWMRGACGLDVGRADAGVHVALAVPHVHAPG